MRFIYVVVYIIALFVFLFGLYLLAYSDINHDKIEHMAPLEVRRLDVLEIIWFFVLIFSVFWASFRLVRTNLYKGRLRGYLLKSPDSSIVEYFGL
jgi:hypothetical protein